MSTLDDARDELRSRLGVGARFDAPNAPSVELLWARTGTAYFARKLNELSDDELYGPSKIAGLNRAYIVALVSYQARALAHAAEEIRTRDNPHPKEDEQPDRVASAAATLPARALRHLFQHSEVHLNVEWRDLREIDWDVPFVSQDLRASSVRGTPWLRAYAIWLSAVDLGNGGSFEDFPSAMLDRLLQEAASRWVGDPFVLAPTDRAHTISFGFNPSQFVLGTTADLARWITGRGEPPSMTPPLPAIRPAAIWLG